VPETEAKTHKCPRELMRSDAVC